MATFREPLAGFLVYREESLSTQLLPFCTLELYYWHLATTLLLFTHNLSKVVVSHNSQYNHTQCLNWWLLTCINIIAHNHTKFVIFNNTNHDVMT